MKYRSIPRALALAVASAILMTLALPNEIFKHGIVPLGFIALVPLYLAILSLPGPKSAALVAGIFGSMQHALSSYWLWFFKDFRIWTLGSTTLAYFFIYSVLGLYLWLILDRGGRSRPLGFMLLWTAFEFQKSTGFLGYPWGLLPYSLTDALPMLQIADITGLYGVTLVLAACNAAVAEFLLGIGASRKEALSRRGRLAFSTLALCLVAFTLTYGLLRLAKPIPRVATLNAVLVQQNTDPWVEGDEDASVAANIGLAREALEREALSPERRKVDIIMFSETSLLRPYAEFRDYFNRHPVQDPLIPFIRESGSWLLTGAPEIISYKPFEATNSAILIDPQTRLVRSYAKVHPVPFAEAIPFMEYPGFKKFMQEVVGLESGWEMGTKYTLFEYPSKEGRILFGVPICFEDAFAEVCRHFTRGGADLLINITDMSWSKTESAEIQQWAAARFRSIESRKTLVRSTHGGLSCVIGPFGETLDALPLFVPASKFVEVPIFRDASPTINTLWGDWFATASLLLTAALSLILIAADLTSRRAAFPMQRARRKPAEGRPR
jgi:apolipoprotein N-acyltransferase